uniref:EGF-like domain-containing protein n=1 Tax=Biomphalaria glabrata TaxID=6526 RepID=A0A2C9KB17_BIOGL
MPEWFLFLFLYCATAIAQVCDNGFMGPQCKFKCHDNCNLSYKCARGYFGPYCQYVNLVTIDGDVLTDHELSTCRPLSKKFPFVIRMTPGVISFTQIEFHSNAELSGISLEYQSKNGSAFMKCPGEEQQNFNDDNTVDIYCLTIGIVSKIKLNVENASSLCEVYISGGRNIALKAWYNVSSSHADLSNPLGVTDGLRGSRDDADTLSGCYLSEPNNHTKHSVTIVFNVPVILYNIVIYRRPNSSLLNFELVTHGPTGTGIAMRYKDNRTELPDIIYLPHANFDRLIKMLTLDVPNVRESPFGICELEALGDCEPLRYGLACLTYCSPTCKDSLCNLAGRCLSCPVGKYGSSSCSPSCSRNCLNGSYCYRNGSCINGCNRPYYDEKCTLKCNNKGCDQRYGCHVNGTCKSCGTGFTGSNCIEKCSDHCGGNSSCDRFKGFCKDGCKDGFYGSECDEQCNDRCGGTLRCDFVSGVCLDGCKEGYYGENCLNVCSSRCGGIKACNYSTGDCIYGCIKGFYGDKCHLKCHLNCKDGCDVNTAECNHGCLSGLTGRNCTKRCSEKCGGVAECDQSTEICVVCKAGYYGPDCLTSFVLLCDMNVSGSTRQQAYNVYLGS